MAAPDFKLRFQETMKLLDYGFANFTRVQAPAPENAPGSLPVTGGALEEVTLNYQTPGTVLLQKGEEQSCGQNWKSLWAAEPVNSRTAGQFRRRIRKNCGLSAIHQKSLRIFYACFPVFNL